MKNLAFININNIENKKDIFVFNNDFNSECWSFKDFLKSKSTPSYSINFNIVHNNINLLEQAELLIEIKTILYNRFKSGLKIRTNITYFSTIIPFIKFMFDKNKTSLNKLTKEDFEEYKSIAKKRQDLNAINGFFKYKSNTEYSLSFKPYNENVKKLFKTKSNQTKILDEKEWKDICIFAENNILEFLKNKNVEKEYNKFISNYYNNKGDFKLINFAFKKQFNTIIGDIKRNRANVIISSGMLIQAYTGMRISELLSLKRNCIIKEELSIADEKVNIIKIKGKTFKYRNSNGELMEEGVETTWYAPDIIIKVIESLELISEHYFNMFNCDDLFINPTVLSKVTYKTELNGYYNEMLKDNKIIDKNINSHMFRRTLARFFAKSVLDIPVEALKEQYKHFDKSITHYYMRDTEMADNSFIELMEDYSKELIKGNISKSKKISKFIKRNIKDAITTANNLEELTIFLDKKKIEVVNDYMATINKKNGKLSPIECLTCEGNLILPDLHIDYWNEMLMLYKELLTSEPNSFWYKKEYEQIKSVVKKLNNNEAYISKGTK